MNMYGKFRISAHADFCLNINIQYDVKCFNAVRQMVQELFAESLDCYNWLPARQCLNGIDIR